MPRLRYIPVYTDFFIDCLKGGEIHAICVDNVLPQDTKMVRMGHDQLGSMFIVVESEEFDDIGEYDEIPQHPKPLFKRLDNSSSE